MINQIAERIVEAPVKNTACDTQTPSVVSVQDDYQSIENERVRVFQEKRSAENLNFKFEQTYDPEKKQVFLRYANGDLIDSSLDMGTKIRSSLCAALGTASDTYSLIALSQVVNAQFVDKDTGANKANATVEALISMAPQDIIEGQLCSRLVILQDQSAEFMRRAARPDTPFEFVERYINSATKLMRMYNETLETLNRYRRKGEQKVTVQYVNINGGQAVVTGQLNQAGGGSNQKGKGAAHV